MHIQTIFIIIPMICPQAGHHRRVVGCADPLDGSLGGEIWGATDAVPNAWLVVEDGGLGTSLMVVSSFDWTFFELFN